jgi:hypothetical protein
VTAHGGKESSDNKVHAWIARVGVLGIAAGAFRVSYDAWTTVSKASGIRPALAGYLPWITEGFLALAVYTAWVVRKRGSQGRYPIALAFVLLAIGVYVQVRHGAAHGHTLALTPVEAGAISALPTIITAASIHLLVLTFEKVTHAAEQESPEFEKPSEPVADDFEQWASEPAVEEPLPLPEIEEPEVTSPSAGPFPDAAEAGFGATPVALRGAGNFYAMADKATSPRARQYWLTMAEEHKL